MVRAVFALAVCVALSGCGGGGAPSFTVGGVVSGLNTGSQVTLENGADRAAVAANGAFSFTQSAGSGTAYSVRVAVQPPGQLCTVANPSGTIGSANVTSVQVTCISPPAVSLGSSALSAYQGDNVTLTWSSAGAVSCAATGSWTGALQTSGSTSVTLTTLGSGAFGIVCTNPMQSTSAQVVVDVTRKPLLSPTPLLLPDIRPKFEALCGAGKGAAIQNGIAVNLSGHKDGRKDLVFTLWCPARQAPGVSNTAPTPNGLVAYVQAADGSFRDATRELFGQDIVDIGGNPHYGAAGDFNRDGLDDMVFSVSREDGRDWSVDHDLNGVQPAFVTSTAAGRYVVERKGKPEWGYGAIKIDNEVGGEDVLVAGEVYDVWRYTDKWTLVANYGTWATPRTYFFKRSAPNQTSRVAVVGENSGKQLSLYYRDAAGSWSLQSFFSYAQPNPPVATFIGWNGMVGTQTITRIDGQDYTYIYFDTICELRPAKTAPALALVAFTGSEIIGGFKGQVLTEGLGMTGVTKLMAFSVDGGVLRQVPLGITADRIENISLYGAGSKCGDFNGDGLDDYLLVNASGAPIVYLNDGAGSLRRVSSAAYPAPPGGLGQVSSLYEDITGDGIPDLVYFSVTGGGNVSKPLQFPVFRGLRRMDPGDH